MLKPEDHPHEAQRLETIQALELLNTDSLDIVDAVLRLLKSALDIPVTLFSVVGSKEQVFKGNIGLDADRTSRAVSFCAHAILQENVFVVENASMDPRFEDNPLVTGPPYIRFYAGAVVSAPDGMPVGTVCVIDQQPRRYDDTYQSALLDAKYLVEEALKLQMDAGRDHLTGLYNRRYFDERCRQEWRRAIRHMAPLSVVMIDIDHFKKYNDRFGHAEGDVCLRLVANALASISRRPGDLVARFGGEEFVAVLSETPISGAEVIASRILYKIRSLAIPHPDSETGLVTVSVGVCVFEGSEGKDVGFDELLKEADTALYEAKDAGRNQVILKRAGKIVQGSGGRGLVGLVES